MGLKQVQALPLLPAATAETFALVQDAGVTSKLGVSGLLRQFDVTSFGVSTAKNGAQNDVAIATAIAAAVAQSAELYWPPGAYASEASLANLHTVRHRGTGRIVRGLDTFYLEPKNGQSNGLYVSPSGSGSADGLSASQPMSIDTAFSALLNYGPTLSGTWTVWLAAGTYVRATQLTIEGLQSVNPIRFRGPEVGGSPNAPTAILDGATSTGGVCGLYFRCNMRVDVRNIWVKNYASSDAHGIIIDRFTEGVFTNVWTSGCEQAGLHADSTCRLYVVGGKYELNIYYNIRVYAGGVCSIGSSGVTGRVTIGNTVNAGGAGIHIRDHSSGHVDYVDFVGVTGSGGGLEITNQSRVHLVDCEFSGCYYNIRCDQHSTYIEDAVTHGATTAHDVACWGFSIPTADQQRVYYDPTTGWFKFGRTDVLTPKALLEVADPATARWGGAFHSSVLHGVDGSGDAYVGIGMGATSTGGIHFATPSQSRDGAVYYDANTRTIYVRAGNTDLMRWFSGNGSPGGYVRPEQTGANAPALGDATHPWERLYFGAAGVFLLSGSGTPEGAVTAPVGSLYTRTNGGAGTTLYVKESGAGNTGWVAK